MVSETLTPFAGPYRHVYLHVPFCGRRCSYCDFAIAVRRIVPVFEYVDAIMAELLIRQISLDASQLRSIYLGGGTPSKLGGTGIATLLGRIAQRAGVDNLSTFAGSLETTIEVNPEDVTAESVAEWRRAGVNRASMGVQSFNAEVLRWMHREHSPEQVAEAVRLLRNGGIEDLSIDLIFAVPETLNRDWNEDLERALALSPNHLSLYGLTIEPATPLGKWMARGEVAESPEERYEGEFLGAHERLLGAGFEHYEVSNYGLPGHRSKHNSTYWSGAPYLGLGPSAHGFDGQVRRWNRSAYADWLRAVQGGVDPMAGDETIGEKERQAEAVYLGLRTTGGLELHQNDWTTVTSWIDAGWANRQGDRLVLTPAGWLRLDSLAASLTSSVAESLTSRRSRS